MSSSSSHVHLITEVDVLKNCAEPEDLVQLFNINTRVVGNQTKGKLTTSWLLSHQC